MKKIKLPSVGTIFKKILVVIGPLALIGEIVMAGYQIKEILAEPSAAVDCSDAKARNEY
jgi:hypothetical protein